MPAELFRAIGLLPDGPALLGRPIRAPGPGVYMVEQPAPTAAPRIDLSTIGKWIELLKETVPSISRLAAVLDRSGPSSQAFQQQMQRDYSPTYWFRIMRATEDCGYPPNLIPLLMLLTALSFMLSIYVTAGYVR